MLIIFITSKTQTLINILLSKFGLLITNLEALIYLIANVL